MCVCVYVCLMVCSAERIIQSHFSSKNLNSPQLRQLSCQKMKHRKFSMNLTDHQLREAYLEEGKFVAIIDMTNVSLFSSRPSISVVSEAVELIKYSYPNRLASLYIVNAGYIFSMIWKLIQPTLSETSIGKIFFLSSLAEAQSVLPLELGIDGLDSDYGGSVNEIFNSEEYFDSIHLS